MTTALPTTSATTSSGQAVRCSPAGRWSVAAIAPVAALVVWVAAVPLGGVELEFTTGDQVAQVGPVAVALASGLAALASVVLATPLARRSRRPRRTWTVLGTVLCVLSLVGPLGATSATAVAVLSGMHAVVGGVLVRGLGRTLPAVRADARAR